MSQYDPKLVTVSFNGVQLLNLAEGQFVTVTRDEDAYTKTVGSGGNVIRSRNNNRAGTATVVLMADSPSNAYLSAMARADELGGAGMGQLLVSDVLGSIHCVAPKAWIKKIPDAVASKDANDMNREWVFDFEFVDITIGGLVP